MQSGEIERDGGAPGKLVRACTLVSLMSIAACGGPSVPSEVPASSPLSRDAPSAPLPEIGNELLR